MFRPFESVSEIDPSIAPVDPPDNVPMLFDGLFKVKVPEPIKASPTEEIEAD
jgi:hypothetical protein